MDIKTEIFIKFNHICRQFPKDMPKYMKIFFRNYSSLSISKAIIKIQFQSSIKVLWLILFYHNI